MRNGFPARFEERMKKQLGEEWVAFADAHGLPAPVSARLNPRKKYSFASETERIPWTENGVYLTERPLFTMDPLFHAGCYYVQEASSMFLEQAIRQHIHPSSSLRVLDLCAAPGGKSTHLLSLLDSGTLLISNEVIRSRVNILSENIQKWGYHNVVVTNNDPADFNDLAGFFDVVVLDAPCSGEGLFRKDSGAIHEWSEENVSICSQRQQRIIEDIWPCLKENGVLIYSTCTYNSSENEEILQWINSRHKVEFLSIGTSGEGIAEIRQNAVVAYRFFPHRVKGEGFFISALRKRESEPERRIKAAKSGFAVPDKKVRAEVADWVIDPNEKIILRNDLLQLLPAAWSDDIYFLTQRLKVVYAGTFLATVKHNKLVPEHALALSTQLKKENFHQTNLSEKESLQYLRKEALSIDSDRKGFSLALYNGIPIGWMNLLGDRMNNLYPSEWRIRMQIPN
jgi:NOL1/NOP2/sun family putative RNA methylase